jgi:hypothetical protein
MSKEAANLFGTKRRRVPLIVKQDELSDPAKVGLFGSATVMAGPHLIANLFQQFGHGEAPALLSHEDSRPLCANGRTCLANPRYGRYYMNESPYCNTSFSRPNLKLYRWLS